MKKHEISVNGRSIFHLIYYLEGGIMSSKNSRMPSGSTPSDVMKLIAVPGIGSLIGTYYYLVSTLQNGSCSSEI